MHFIYGLYRKSFSSIIVLLALCCLIGCMQNEEDAVRPDNSNIQNSTTSFIYNAIPENAQATISSEYNTAVNTFAVNLLGEVYGSDDFHNKNVVLSPFCISRNLAILTGATTGDSRQELLQALGGQAALDDARSAVSRLLYADKSIILQIADAIWIDSTRYALLPSFKDTANKKYGVEVSGLDFGDKPGSVAAINRWIADNTGNRIKDVVKEEFIKPLTVLFLTSTIYFEADWASPFDVTKTESALFSAPGGPVNVPMMSSSYQHRTFKTDEYDNAKIYYGSNNENFFYLDVYMPTTISIEAFIADNCLTALEQQDSLGYGGLKMPKFFFENEINLKPVLRSLGVSGVFDPSVGAITGMAMDRNSRESSALYVDVCIHRTGIKSDEEGTVAYAVTVSAGAVGSSFDPSPDVVLDRPFVYFIRAGETGLVIFAGVVNNPNERS